MRPPDPIITLVAATMLLATAAAAQLPPPPRTFIGWPTNRAIVRTNTVPKTNAVITWTERSHLWMKTDLAETNWTLLEVITTNTTRVPISGQQYFWRFVGRIPVGAIVEGDVDKIVWQTNQLSITTQ